MQSFPMIMTDFELQIKHAPFHLDQVSNNLSFEKPKSAQSIYLYFAN